uniref:Uncharacterized protein n=1 Tax=Timema cristinae TaxID=61476 RepID=A0A7R9DD14_TIMCR|nr:unnamed protein product [Timema cristinae]
MTKGDGCKSRARKFIQGEGEQAISIGRVWKEIRATTLARRTGFNNTIEEDMSFYSIIIVSQKVSFVPHLFLHKLDKNL